MQKHLLLLSLSLLAVDAAAQAPSASPVADPSARRCESAATRLKLDGFELAEAEYVPAGTSNRNVVQMSRNPAVLAMSLPAHCRIKGSLEKRTGANGKPYAIALELRVPDEWNKRLVFQGGGGTNGILFGAIGPAVSMASTAEPALMRGYAVVSTDSGHTGFGGEFASDQLALLNYAYASIGKVVGAAKSLLLQYAGGRPAHTYYTGCSNGGREALIAAQRFPEEFDGIIAANPASDPVASLVLRERARRAYASIAPTGPDAFGKPELALTQAEWKLVSTSIVNSCDAADGLKDGFIFNQNACQFRPATLQCRKGSTESCLSKAKVGALELAFSSLKRPSGEILFNSWTFDASVGSADWVGWQTRRDHFESVFRYPPVTDAELYTETIPAKLAGMEQIASLVRATSTNYSSFTAGKGKMLLVHGWSDPILAPQPFVDWYGKLTRDTMAATGKPATDFARLFMVPGLLHCGGGDALDDFDALSALADWVEKGKAPESLLAKGAKYPGVTRPICAFPKIARYNGSGDVSLASSFTCS